MLNRETMRSLLLLSFIIFIFGITASAKTYYISNSGNDANAGTDPSAPWQTIKKLNSVSLSPGDNVLFNCGDTFYGSIIISNSGSSGAPITYGSYGTGAKPVITGFTTVTSWTNLGGNIWGSASVISSLSYCNMVSVNGVNTGMGRYPNKGYLTYQSYSGNTSITSSSLKGTPNWTGASVAIKKLRYVITVGSITAQSGGTLTYTDDALYTPSDNFGLFIQNDKRTLDTANEWYYNPKTGKIDIYSTSSPTNVQVATVQNLMVAASGVSYISVMNISFIGSNSDALNFNNNGNNNNNHITVENCSISKAGVDGISEGGSYTNIENNTLTDINNTALNLSDNCSNASVINNTLKRVGLIPGMTQTNSVGSLCSTGPNSLIQYNRIDSSGYIGIRFRGMNTIVKNNFVNHSCLIKDDGGGIYTWGAEKGRQITGNIILNSIGNADGTNQPTNFLAHGIHLDGGTEFVTVSGNTLSGCRGVGIFVQQSTNIIINGNTSYNNGFPGNWMKGAIMLQATASAPIENISLKNNIFFAETLKQLALFYYTPSTNANDLLQFGTADSNYYARPLDDDDSIIFTQTGLGNNYYNPSNWNSYMGQDAQGSPKSITSPDNLLFEYNASTSSTKIALNANYIDVTGKTYNGTITLAPYTSAVLIKNGPLTAAQSSWTASAGPNQTITLPVSTTTLTGSSSDASTYISSYVWTKKSGPSGGVVTSNWLKTITLTGLVQGVYNYQVVITDNTGVSSTANVSVTVNAAQSSWTASAGPNQTITLPVSTTTLTGSSSDASTYISSYVWTKTSGPTGGVVTNYSLKTITLTGLVQGVYNYQVVITDNTGVSSTANVSVTVNAALGSASNLGANASDSMNINYGADSILSVNSANPSSSLNEIQMSNLLKVYPNPVANVTTLEINIPIPNTDVMMTITDMNGSTVYKKKINSEYGLVSEQIDMSRFQEGVYMLSVILNGQIIKSLKVVKLAIN